jgi:protein HOOK3
MIKEIRENDSAELTKLRDESDEINQKIHTLQAELDASLALARETCAERDELRAMLDNRQLEIAESSVEDQETMEEMKKLLAEIAAQDSGDASEASQKSGVELTKQVVGLIERNLERLAQRAEVSESKPNPTALATHGRSASHSDII